MLSEGMCKFTKDMVREGLTLIKEEYIASKFEANSYIKAYQMQSMSANSG